MTEAKYIMVIMVAFLVVMFGSEAVSSYQKNQCRQAALQAGKTVDEINKLCN
jgi:sensor histidine kinase regulating citrate/malate metabolism